MKNNHLHFVQSGRLSVRNKTGYLPSIRENQFVGVLSFLTWEHNLITQVFIVVCGYICIQVVIVMIIDV